MGLIKFSSNDSRYQALKEQYYALRRKVYNTQYNSSFYDKPLASDEDANTVFALYLDEGDRVIAGGRLLVKSSADTDLLSFEDSPEHRFHARFPDIPRDTKIAEISAVVVDPSAHIFAFLGEKVGKELRAEARRLQCDISVLTVTERNAAAILALMETEGNLHARAFPDAAISHDGVKTLLIMSSPNHLYDSTITAIPGGLCASECPRPRRTGKSPK